MGDIEVKKGETKYCKGYTEIKLLPDDMTPEDEDYKTGNFLFGKGKINFKRKNGHGLQRKEKR